MPLFAKPLIESGAEDIQALVRDRIADDSVTEFKREVQPDASGKIRVLGARADRNAGRRPTAAGPEGVTGSSGWIAPACL